MMKKYLDASHDAGVEFISFILTCTDAENERRMLSQKETASGTAKLTDPIVLTNIRTKDINFAFGDKAAFEEEIDVTELTPAEQ